MTLGSSGLEKPNEKVPNRKSGRSLLTEVSNDEANVKLSLCMYNTHIT